MTSLVPARTPASRRAVLGASAWTVPAIVVASAAPAAAVGSVPVSISVLDTTADATTGEAVVRLLLTPAPTAPPSASARYSKPATPSTQVLEGIGVSGQGTLYRFSFALAQPPATHLDVNATITVPSYGTVVASAEFRLGAAAGTADIAFIANTLAGPGANELVRSLAVQPDGKVLVAGDFTAVDRAGGPTRRLTRVGADGADDAAFTTNLGTGFDQSVQSVIVQADGGIVAGGDFTSLDGTPLNRLARLQADGTQDVVFTDALGTGFDTTVSSLAAQPDGKVLAGGYFTTFNGTPVGRLVRLNASGTHDTAFSAKLGAGFNNPVNAVAVQADGKIVVAGTFSTLDGAQARYLVRLNADGTRDAAFDAKLGSGLTGPASAVAVQPDGKILVGGTFARRLVRLNPDGTRDTAFDTNIGTGFDGAVQTVAVRSDGKILVGGTFTTLSGVPANLLVRLGADGARDTAFTAALGGTNPIVMAVVPRPDGRVIAGGGFTTASGAVVNRLVMLDTAGSRDPVFGPDLGTGLDQPVNAVAVQSDGKVIVGGGFTVFGGKAAGGLLRLNGDGTRDTVFATNLGAGFAGSVNTIAIQPDGKILVGGNFTTLNGTYVPYLVRLNADGTRDSTFSASLNAAVNTIAVQTDGKILVGGAFTSVNSTTANRLARLTSTGGRDATSLFNLGSGTTGGFNDVVNTVVVQTDAKILVGGKFTMLNGTTVNRLVRLTSTGTLDGNFTNGLGSGTTGGFDSAVNTLVVQSDGKILVGGSFTTLRGSTANRLVRLSTDGSRDAVFRNGYGVGVNDSVSAVVVGSGGTMIVGGSFTSLNGATANRLVRLAADGARDATYTTNLGAGPDAVVNALAVQADGKTVVGGSFTQVGPYVARRLARIA